MDSRREFLSHSLTGITSIAIVALNNPINNIWAKSEKEQEFEVFEWVGKIPTYYGWGIGKAESNLLSTSEYNVKNELLCKISATDAIEAVSESKTTYPNKNLRLVFTEQNQKVAIQFHKNISKESFDLLCRALRETNCSIVKIFDPNFRFSRDLIQDAQGV